jgi:serine/threonine-protein kinase
MGFLSQAPIGAMTEHEDSELASDDTLDAVLREVARPPLVPQGALAHIHVPSTIDMPEPAVMAVVSEHVAREPRAGEVLEGRWQIEAELGRGGMGVVYAARNLRTEKRVAIKWLATRGAGSPAQVAHMVERFRREARAAAGIRHPNVVEVYDVGGPDDAPFLVMELLEGESLRTRLARGPLSWEEACQIMIPVMRGVAAAHRAGVVHRDLKPDNLFLCEHDGGLVPKVLDFGVAAMKSASHDGLGSLTRSGTVVGTPSYMPLEQLMGKDVDERADVYALGVVLYECLTGVLPFAARSASELAVLQATEGATALSRHRPELRGAGEATVMKALLREPGDRHQSVDAFLDAIEATLHEAPVAPGASARILWLSMLIAALVVLALGWWRSANMADPPNVEREQGSRPDVTALSSDRVPAKAPLVPPENVQERAPAQPEHEPNTIEPRELAPESRPKTSLPGRDKPRVKPAVRAPKAASRAPTDIDFDDF